MAFSKTRICGVLMVCLLVLLGSVPAGSVTAAPPGNQTTAPAEPQTAAAAENQKAAAPAEHKTAAPAENQTVAVPDNQTAAPKNQTATPAESGTAEPAEKKVAEPAEKGVAQPAEKKVAEPAGQNGQSVSQAQQPATDDLPTFNEVARFIAGLPTPGGSLQSLEKQAAWSRYAAAMNRSWGRFDTRQLKPMKTWAAQELKGEETATVFYPFSGPDFVNLYTLFPRAKTYVLVALEPPGALPDLRDINLATFFGSLQNSLYEYLYIDFFITAKMAANISKSQLRGVLPVLLCFLARQEAKVVDIHFWRMQPDGAVVEQSAAEDAEPGPGIKGLRLVFTGPGSTEEQTLYYFQCNLCNNSYRQKPQFISFLKGFGPLTTFTKAASYVMFNPVSSDLRQFILEQSRYVLQDDSGLPLKEFGPEVWNLKFYGTYKGPINLFKNCHQKDLAGAYRRGQNVYPLSFGIGYHHRAGTSNLLFAAKKTKLSAK